MNKRAVFTIAKKEFFGFTNSSLAYTIIVPFLLLSVFLYTRSALVTGEASLRPYFDLLPWFLLLLAPALSMRVLTDEYKNGTLELLFAHPLTELEVILGKYLGVLAFYLLILATTLGLPLTLFAYAHPDPGQIIGQYLGAALTGGVFLAVGLAASSYVKNAISGFLVAASLSFLLIIIGLDFILMLLPAPLNGLVAAVAVLTHTDALARGLLDIRDVAYFLTVISVFLTAAMMKLSERKLAESPKEKRKMNLALAAIIGIGLVANALLTSYPLRLDLTADRLFTLSAGTKQTLKNLPDLVTVSVYASPDLPAQMQLTFREVSDLLKDYQKYGKNLRVNLLHPAANSPEAAEAQAANIQQVTFNKVGTGKFESQSGFLGLSLRYGDKTETIPFIADTSDLEYQLTRKIRKLTDPKEKVVGLLTNAKNAQNQILNEILSAQYKTEPIGVNDYGKLQDLAALIAIDDGSTQSTASAILGSYLEKNGHLLLLASGLSIDQQNLTAAKSLSSIGDVLKNYGLTLNNDLVFDLQLNELLTFGTGNNRFIAPYPYWIKALPAETKFAPLASAKSLSLGWPSSLTLAAKAGFNYRNLLTTSVGGGKVENNFNLYPEAIRGLTAGDSKISVAYSVEKDDLKLIVVGTNTVADDSFLQNNQDNMSFLANSVDYLATDKDVALIPSRSSGHPVFEFRSPQDSLLVQYGNLLIPPLLVIIFAAWKLRRRKILTQRIYED